VRHSFLQAARGNQAVAVKRRMTALAGNPASGPPLPASSLSSAGSCRCRRREGHDLFATLQGSVSLDNDRAVAEVDLRR